MSRIAEFDRDEVIHKAMLVFWERGYGRTSVTDLVIATGLKPGSLYAAFGSKQGIFVEVLACYNRRFSARVEALAESGKSALDIIHALLQTIADNAIDANDQRGCLAVNSLLELAKHDPDIAVHLRRHNENMIETLTQLLERAQAEGDVSQRRDPRALAGFLLTNIWGMHVLCKSRPDRAALAGVVDGVLASLTAA